MSMGAGVAEPEDAPVSETGGPQSHEGSTPSPGTTPERAVGQVAGEDEVAEPAAATGGALRRVCGFTSKLERVPVEGAGGAHACGNVVFRGLYGGAW